MVVSGPGGLVPEPQLTFRGLVVDPAVLMRTGDGLWCGIVDIEQLSLVSTLFAGAQAAAMQELPS